MGLLSERIARLRAAHPVAGDLVEPWLRDGSEEDVFRACPIVWAKARSLDPDTAVEMLLHATHAGLLRIGWELNCPGCGLLIDSVERLGDVDNHFNCAMCGEGKDLALDDWIQVTFTVRPEVRTTRYHSPDALSVRDRVIHCEAGKGVAVGDGERLQEYFDRRIFLAARIEPNAVAVGELNAEQGLLLTCPMGGVPIGGEPEETRIVLSVGDEGGLEGLPEQLPTGKLVFEVRNTGGRPRDVWLFQSEHYYKFSPPIGYAASRLIHHAAYRELFPSQVSCSGRLAIRDVTLLFSDVFESTAMYRRIGDLKAYEKVREHFAVMAPVIRRHGGLWVKDIGDAVMASFTRAEQAAAAAVEMLRAVSEHTDLDIKVGVHSGPCIGVDYRGQLDWFGSTVNLAARVQSLAGAGELCLSEESFARAGQVLDALASSSFETTVRGIDTPIRVHRVPVVQGPRRVA